MESKMMGDSRDHAHGASVKALGELLGRLEAATGADRKLDADIGRALGWYQATYDGMFIWNDAKGLHQSINPTPFTAGLDAAFGLVERVLPGTLWELYRIKAGGFMANLPDVDSGFGPTPALALLTALVRALISNADSAGPQDEGGGSSSATRLDPSCAPPESGGQAGGGDHLWHERFSLTCCKRCGIVKRRNGLNKPCPGPVRIGLRNRAGADRFEP